MKLYRFILIAVASTSCNEVPKPFVKSTDTTKDWHPKILKRQKHTYTQSGLLDTTYRAEEYYVNGLPGGKIDFLVTRQYDSRNNLRKEKTFQLLNKKKFLSEETIYEYDQQNNLVLKKNTFQNVLSELSSFKYNGLRQKIQEVKIQKLPDILPENWNIDSAIAHSSDRQIHTYDTITVYFNYDENGNLTRQVQKKDNKIVETWVTIFANNLKTLTFEINPKGDTISITKYQKDDNLRIEIRSDKMSKLYSDTSIYDESRKLQSVSLNKIVNYRHKETFKYDKKGNQIEFITFD